MAEMKFFHGKIKICLTALMALLVSCHESTGINKMTVGNGNSIVAVNDDGDIEKPVWLASLVDSLTYSWLTSPFTGKIIRPEIYALTHNGEVYLMVRSQFKAVFCSFYLPDGTPIDYRHSLWWNADKYKLKDMTLLWPKIDAV